MGVSKTDMVSRVTRVSEVSNNNLTIEKEWLMEKTNHRSDVTTSDHKHKYQTNSTTYIGVSVVACSLIQPIHSELAPLLSQ